MLGGCKNLLREMLNDDLVADGQANYTESGWLLPSEDNDADDSTAATNAYPLMYHCLPTTCGSAMTSGPCVNIVLLFTSGVQPRAQGGSCLLVSLPA